MCRSCPSHLHLNAKGRRFERALPQFQAESGLEFIGNAELLLPCEFGFECEFEFGFDFAGPEELLLQFEFEFETGLLELRNSYFNSNSTSNSGELLELKTSYFSLSSTWGSGILLELKHSYFSSTSGSTSNSEELLEMKKSYFSSSSDSGSDSCSNSEGTAGTGELLFSSDLSSGAAVGSPLPPVPSRVRIRIHWN